MKYRIRLTAFFLPFVLGLFFTPGLASAQETFKDTEVVERETAAEDAAARAADKAEKKRITETPGPVTFRDILQAPDDVELNYRYALDQVKANDLLGASGTLERILLIEPSLHSVRLLYAVVLFRLDNLQEAQRELALLTGPAVPAPVREEALRYQKEIKRRNRPYRLSLRETAGFGIDTNRNAAPSSKSRLFGNVPLGISGSSSKERDTSFLNITSFDAAHRLPGQAGHEVFGNFTYFLQEQTTVDSLDLQSFQYELGTLFKNRWFNFTPSFLASHITLSRESFLRTQGGNFQIDRKFGTRTAGFGSFRIERQDYLPISENAASPERKGTLYEYTTGLVYTLTPSMQLYAVLNIRTRTRKKITTRTSAWR